MISRVLALLAVLALPACTKDGDCDKTVDHIVALIKKENPSAPEANRAELVKGCKDKGLTKKQEDCVLAAKSLPDLNQCDRK